MASVTYYTTSAGFPFGLDYLPPLEYLLELAGDYSTKSVSATQAIFEYEAGMFVRIKGTGLTKTSSGGLGDTGNITSIEFLHANGTSVFQKITLSMPTEQFVDAVDGFNVWNLSAWLLRGNDTFTGTGGTDEFYGYAGNDIINAGGGDYDYVEGGEGKDTYDGGAGLGDTLSFQDAYFNGNADHGIVLDATKGTVTDPYGNSETFKNFEDYRGTQFADSFKGSSLDERFMGLGGKDVIDGGGGFDTVTYHRDVRRGADQGVTVDLSKGTGIDGFGKTDTLINIEAVRGTELADKITGNSVGNYLRAGDGDDILAGGLGNDTLDGEGGKDIFVFNTTLSATNNVDMINNFSVADDTIRLENAIFTKISGLKTLTAAQFVKNTSGLAADSSDRIIYETDTGNLYYDADGTGAAARVLFAKLDPGLAVTAADFYII